MLLGKLESNLTRFRSPRHQSMFITCNLYRVLKTLQPDPSFPLLQHLSRSDKMAGKVRAKSKRDLDKIDYREIGKIEIGDCRDRF
jgi:hypothetical protein